MSVKRRDLGQLEELDRGAVGVVHRVRSYRLPGFPGELAYKEIRSDIDPKVRSQATAAMTASVAFRESLTTADRADLDCFTCWPLSVVLDSGQVVGALLPLIPSDFFVTVRPHGRPPAQRVFNLSWLSAKESVARKQGIDRSGVSSALVRLALLMQLVYAVGRLHKHGLVYGDLSLKNAAVALQPPRLLLLDCDAVARLDDPGRDQQHSPFFCPPELQRSGNRRLQDQRTDVYKLGLCLIRGLQQGEGISQTTDPRGLLGTLDGPAVDMVARAVHPDPAQRPTAKELFLALERFLLSQAQPPVLDWANLSREMLLRGQDVTVHWSARGATEIRISAPNLTPIVIRDGAHLSGPYSFRPPASGEVHVHAANRHGETVISAGRIELFELPAFQVDLTGLPHPHIDALPTLAVPDFPTLPLRLADTSPVPQLDALDLTPVHDALAQASAVLPTHGVTPSLNALTGEGASQEMQRATSALARLTSQATADTAQVLTSALASLAQAMAEKRGAAMSPGQSHQSNGPARRTSP